MNVTFLDGDTREVIRIVDCPKSPEHTAPVMEFVAHMGGAIARTVPHQEPDAWTVELKIPTDIRRLHTPLPGDRVCFMAQVGVHEHEVTGVYQFRRGYSYIIRDDGGGEWEVQSVWRINKLRS